MSILLIMIPISLFLGFGYVALFIWSNNNEQFEDLVSPAYKILDENDDKFLNNKQTNKDEINEPRSI